MKFYGERGEPEKAVKTTSYVVTLLVMGVLTGFVVVVSIVVLAMLLYV